MNIEKMNEISRQQNVKLGRTRKREVIRAIQQAERNLVCFGTDKAAQCGQNKCIWRDDCV